MRTTILILIVIVATGRNASSQSSGYKDISTFQSHNEQIDFSKLAFLKSELEKANIVLLGEPNHSPKYYDIKMQLVKYLHEQLDFDVLAFESGLYEMEEANSNIKNAGNIYAAFENSLFPIWTSTDEFQNIYNYLDTLRSSKDTLEITGFDCQVSGHYASTRFVAEFQRALSSNNISFDKKLMHVLQAQFENLETGQNGLSKDFNAESLNGLTQLARAISAIPTLSIYHQSLTGWIGHFRDLYHNKIFEKLAEGGFGGKDSNVRDSLMAVNMIYLYKQLYPGKKIIAWGANAHFSNNTKNLDTDIPDSKEFVGMGYHLKQQLGDKVFFLAVTTDENYANTIENELAKKDVSLAWISNPEIIKNEFSSCLLGKPLSGNWSEVVDGIIYFNSSDQMTAEKKDRYFLSGKILNTKENEPVSFANITLQGTTTGTASDIDGAYLFKIDSTDLNKTVKISSIGFKTKYITVKSLLKLRAIYLTPEAELLNEILVKGKAPNAIEILEQAIEKIPQNYLQTPFNMEFFSVHTTLDTINNKSFSVESVFLSYYEGYHKATKKNYKILHKRESGDYYVKEKTHGLSQWPMWEVAFNDIFSNQSEYQIVTLESFKKINPKFIGTQRYDGDTVFVIQYDYKVAGTIYISSKDYAILKHVTTVSGKGFKNRTELLYKKQDGKYFPYAANGDYLHQYKVDGVQKLLKITNRTQLNRIETKSVTPFDHNQNAWIPKNVNYDKAYWNNNYPTKD